MLDQIHLSQNATISDAYAASWLIVSTLVNHHLDDLQRYVQALDTTDADARQRAHAAFNALLENLHPGIVQRMIDPIAHILNHGGRTSPP